MAEKSKIKMSLKVVIIIVTIILVLSIAVAICAYINITGNESPNETINNIIETTEKESNSYSNVDGLCRIIGNGSNLLYKNEYDSDTSYSEKIIYLDEESKANMTSSVDALDADEVLYLGAFDGEFIRIKYDSDPSDYRMSLAYIEDGEFHNCTTNKIVKKAFDKNGNEIEIPKYSYTINIPSDDSTIYALFDITTDEGENYIIGMYDKAFSDSNSNMMLLTVVLKKENVQIDIDNEEQVKEFWNKYATYEIENVEENSQDDYEKVEINGTTYYHRLSENTWGGEYHQDTYNVSIGNNIDIQEVVSYSDYLKYINEVNSKIDEKILNYYTDKKSNYIILSYANGYSWCDMELIDCIEENNQIIIYGDENTDGVMSSGTGYFIAIPTNMPVGTSIEYRECYSTSEISNLQNYSTSQTEVTLDKPIIYLYPTEDTKVSVTLGYPNRITTSYPKYTTGWKVFAETSGNLIDLTTNKKLYSLYYESEAIASFKVEEDGFIVKGEDIATFLEEKLEILGLNERESEEFIIYWLPILQKNKYNYIRFATTEEINENMPLEIYPNPDTTIRVLMTYKGLDNPIEVKKQELVAPRRTGFVAVEWGGTEIK